MDIYNLMKRNGVLEETFSQQNRELELLRVENEKLKQVAAQAENAQRTVEEQVAAINTLSLAALRANRHAENESQKRLREAVRATEEKGKRLDVEMQLEKAKQRQQRLVEGLTEAYQDTSTERSMRLVAEKRLDKALRQDARSRGQLKMLRAIVQDIRESLAKM